MEISTTHYFSDLFMMENQHYISAIQITYTDKIILPIINHESPTKGHGQLARQRRTLGFFSNFEIKSCSLALFFKSSHHMTGAWDQVHKDKSVPLSIPL